MRNIGERIIEKTGDFSMNETILIILIISIPVIILITIQLLNIKYKKRVLSIISLTGYIILTCSILFLYLTLYSMGFYFSLVADSIKGGAEKIINNDNKLEFELFSNYPNIFNIFIILVCLYLLTLLIINIINTVNIKKQFIVTSIILTVIPYFILIFIVLIL